MWNRCFDIEPEFSRGTRHIFERLPLAKQDFEHALIRQLVERYPGAHERHRTGFPGDIEVHHHRRGPWGRNRNNSLHGASIEETLAVQTQDAS